MEAAPDRVQQMVAMETVILAQILRPLFPDDGALGGYGAEVFAREVASRLEMRP